MYAEASKSGFRRWAPSRRIGTDLPTYVCCPPPGRPPDMAPHRRGPLPGRPPDLRRGQPHPARPPDHRVLRSGEDTVTRPPNGCPLQSFLNNLVQHTNAYRIVVYQYTHL